MSISKLDETSPVKYFDYLDNYGDAIQRKIGKKAKISNIDKWRKRDASDIDGICTGCRQIIEQMLNALSKNDPEIIGANLANKIYLCQTKNIIDRSVSSKINSIRHKGNNDAHASISFEDAKECLSVLDEMLRYFVISTKIDIDLPNKANEDKSKIFIVRSAQEKDKLKQKAKIATSLTGNKTIENKVIAKTKSISASEESIIEREMVMSRLLEEVRALKDSAIKDVEEKKPGAEKELEKLEIQQEALFDDLDTYAQQTDSDRKRANDEITAVEDELNDILSEYDFIKKLLTASGNKGVATNRQLEVMAFPKTKNAISNTLMLSGGAGTGKTLCLLAKLISDVGRNALDLGGYEQKTALFLCFNKSLATYVRNMLSNYPDNINIEVAHYDEYVNQLVRDEPKKDFSHLAQYATNVRYDPTWKVAYKDAEKLIEQAMNHVSDLHPNESGSYYLDTSKNANIKWVYEEILWLDSRYENPETAENYIKSSRTGRGTKRRPNDSVRRIILEIWSHFNDLLTENRFYTVQQTTKRLMKADSLPKYDSIAIDEVQDFTIASIKLATKFLRSDKSRLYLSGDEDQKIYQRDFTWKELGENSRGYTISLDKNMRNSVSIKNFAERINGKTLPIDISKDNIHISETDDAGVINLIHKLLEFANDNNTLESIALIGNYRKWRDLLTLNDIPVKNTDVDDITKPGVYVIGEMKGKGLEFDNVVVDYEKEVDDEAIEARLRYVHFTRARKRLYIRYNGEPPKLIRKYYKDFLE